MFWKPTHIHFKYKPSFLAIAVFIAVALVSAFSLYYVDGVFSKVLFGVMGAVPPILAIIAFDRQRQLDHALTGDLERRKAMDAHK